MILVFPISRILDEIGLSPAKGKRSPRNALSPRRGTPPMPRYTVHYRFSQRFPFPAGDAYAWCTDFQVGDVALMGEQGTRRVERIDDSAFILADTQKRGERSETKVRLVRLYPELLMWTNTRISEAGKHSQFIYQIVPEGAKGSRLEFTGAQLDEAARQPSKAELAAAAKRYAENDALVWTHLAEAMGKDLAPMRSRGASRDRAR